MNSPVVLMAAPLGGFEGPFQRAKRIVLTVEVCGARARGCGACCASCPTQ